jgi:hypothetical protein
LLLSGPEERPYGVRPVVFQTKSCTMPSAASRLRFQRSPTGWDEREFRGGEVVTLVAPPISFPVDEIYERVVLDPA